MAYSPSWLSWPPGENKRGSTEQHWFGKESRWMGTMASGEGVWAEKGYVPGKDRGGGLLEWGQWARRCWLGSSHLATSFGFQFTGGLHLFLLSI